jgi:hypothetical protein
VRSISLAFSFIALVFQVILCIGFYQHHGENLLPVLCRDNLIDARFCLIPWWGLGIAPCFTAALMTYSVVKFKVLGRKWWLVFLPALVILLTTFVFLTVPIIYAWIIKE